MGSMGIESRNDGYELPTGGSSSSVRGPGKSVLAAFLTKFCISHPFALVSLVLKLGDYVVIRAESEYQKKAV
jgi:hypothetical protein